MYVDLDMIYALIKKEDMHRETALSVLNMTEQKYISTAFLVELELVLKKEVSDEASKNVFDILQRLSYKLPIKNLDEKTMLLSTEVRKKYNLGIFDSLHAACALLHDKRIASTDDVYDRIDGLTRIF